MEASGCDAHALADVERLREVFARAVAELGLTLVGEARWHKFTGAGGVTGLALLTESHLACHTYPEYQTATFNLYCCRARPRWAWEERLAELLGARQVFVRVVERCAQMDEDEASSSSNARASQQAGACEDSNAGDSSRPYAEKIGGGAR